MNLYGDAVAVLTMTYGDNAYLQNQQKLNIW